MKVSDLQKKLNLEIVTDENYCDRNVTGCYIGDLLSWVMGRAKSGDVWITIMSNINIAAVAALADCSCILLCEGVTPDEKVISKADEEGIIILKSPLTAYELAVKISGEI